MTVAVIAHVEDDRTYVEKLITALNHNRFIVCALDPRGPKLAFGPRLPLVVIWSARAAALPRAARAFVQLARSHGGGRIICAADRHPLPKELERLDCALVDGAPDSAFFPGGLAAALSAAQERAAEAPQAPAPQFSGRAFAGGVVRGLAGGAAVFGVGGAASLALEGLERSEVALEPGAPAAPAAPAAVSVAEASVAEAAFVFPEEKPSPELVELASLALNEADTPLASSGRAERIARQVAAAYRDRPLRPLRIWSPDPEALTPLEPVAPARPLDLYGDGFGAPRLEAAAAPAPPPPAVTQAGAPLIVTQALTQAISTAISTEGDEKPPADKASPVI